MKLKNGLLWILALLVALCMVFTGCNADSGNGKGTDETKPTEATDDITDESEEETQPTEKPTDPIDVNKPLTLADIKPFSGNPYVVINGNQPDFTKSEITAKSYEFYSPLDSLGRCGYAMASLSNDTMPAPGEERGDISKVKPTGWINNAYDTSIVPGRYLYNRCHLIGWQLSAENANKQNLITGTRFMNNEGMLPFENMIADYIKDTGNHVMYRVTPMFDGNNLVASGVHLEAYSVEDEGEGICVNVFLYNVQEGIIIDYATGENKLANPPVEDGGEANPDVGDENVGGDNNDGGDDVGGGDNSDTSEGQTTYILNINPRSKKIHYPDCTSVSDMSEANKQVYTGPLSDIIAEGYTPCGRCNPQ